MNMRLEEKNLRHMCKLSKTA